MLTLKGYNVLQLITGSNGESLYFVVHSFTHPMVDTNYYQAIGVNISTFLENNVTNNPINFMARFDHVMEETPVTRIEFSLNERWRKWGTVSGK